MTVNSSANSVIHLLGCMVLGHQNRGGQSSNVSKKLIKITGFFFFYYTLRGSPLKTRYWTLKVNLWGGYQLFCVWGLLRARGSLFYYRPQKSKSMSWVKKRPVNHLAKKDQQQSVEYEKKFNQILVWQVGSNCINFLTRFLILNMENHINLPIFWPNLKWIWNSYFQVWPPLYHSWSSWFGVCLLWVLLGSLYLWTARIFTMSGGNEYGRKKAGSMTGKSWKIFFEDWLLKHSYS